MKYGFIGWRLPQYIGVTTDIFLDTPERCRDRNLSFKKIEIDYWMNFDGTVQRMLYFQTFRHEDLWLVQEHLETLAKLCVQMLEKRKLFLIQSCTNSSTYNWINKDFLHPVDKKCQCFTMLWLSLPKELSPLVIK